MTAMNFEVEGRYRHQRPDERPAELYTHQFEWFANLEAEALRERGLIARVRDLRSARERY